MGILRDDMTRRMTAMGYAPKTIKLYTSCVGGFSRHFGKSPLLAGEREVESFFLFLREGRRSDATVHLYYESLRFFFRMHGLLGRVPRMSFARIARKLPAILSQAEVRSLLASCDSLKFRTILTLIYSAGLRVSEAANLRLSDVDFARRRIFVRNGKYGKDRYTLLADETAALLLSYARVYRPVSYAFYGADATRPISVDSIQRRFRQAARASLGNRFAHVHTLRHCFATHLIENGTSVFYVMRLLGHSSILTTLKYLHVRDFDGLGLVSPIDAVPPSAAPQSVALASAALTSAVAQSPLASPSRSTSAQSPYPATRLSEAASPEAYLRTPAYSAPVSSMLVSSAPGHGEALPPGITYTPHVALSPPITFAPHVTLSPREEALLRANASPVCAPSYTQGDLFADLPL